MPGPLVHVGAVVICPHGGQVSAVTSNARVLVNGTPVVTLPDTYPVAGCAFAVGPKPQPCVLTRWLVAATRVLVNGQPALVQSGTGLCQSAEQAPQGPPSIVSAQARVVGQ